MEAAGKDESPKKNPWNRIQRRPAPPDAISHQDLEKPDCESAGRGINAITRRGASQNLPFSMAWMAVLPSMCHGRKANAVHAAIHHRPTQDHIERRATEMTVLVGANAFCTVMVCPCKGPQHPIFPPAENFQPRRWTWVSRKRVILSFDQDHPHLRSKRIGGCFDSLARQFSERQAWGTVNSEQL